MMYDDEHLKAEYAAWTCFAHLSLWVALGCGLVALLYAWATI